MIDDVLKYMDGGGMTVAIFIDFKKAFDTIDHVILLKKLKAAGLDDQACALIANYLADRMQVTKIRGISSTTRSISTGVPQGSTLGPLLFIIFINDLPDITNVARFLLFADDAVILVQAQSLWEAELIANGVLAKTNTWCNENKLTVNTKKTEYVIFCSRTKKLKTFPINVTMGAVKLREVHQYKYLGTVLDSTLTMNAQVSKLTQMVAMKMTTFRKIRYCLSENSAKQIYKATILPILDYNDVVYSLITGQQENKLQRIQNNALRIVFKGKILSVQDMHERAGIEFLKIRRETHLMALMYGRAQDSRYLDQTERKTRQATAALLKTPRPRSNKLARAPVCMGSTLWNQLPTKIRQAETKLKFRNLYRSHRLGQPKQHPTSNVIVNSGAGNRH